MPEERARSREESGSRSKIDPILDAAGQVFQEYGFAGARVDEIARRAGVNKAMLYYHVGDKRALFTAVLTRNMDTALARVRAAAAVEAQPEDRLTALTTAFAEAAAEADHLSLVMREATAGGDNLSDEVLQRLLAVARETIQVIGNGQSLGRFRQVEPLLVHLMMVASIMLLTVGRPIRERITEIGPVKSNIPNDPKQLAAAVADVLLHGVVAKERL
jgi:AcrR family transcriptional regulator